MLTDDLRWIQYSESMEVKSCYLLGSINGVIDFISRNIHEIKKIDIVSSRILKLSGMSYNDDDLMQMQLNDPVLKRVINILCNTGHSFCLTSWPAELKI